MVESPEEIAKEIVHGKVVKDDHDSYYEKAIIKAIQSEREQVRELVKVLRRVNFWINSTDRIKLILSKWEAER